MCYSDQVQVGSVLRGSPEEKLRSGRWKSGLTSYSLVPNQYVRIDFVAIEVCGQTVDSMSTEYLVEVGLTRKRTAGTRVHGVHDSFDMLNFGVYRVQS